MDPISLGYGELPGLSAGLISDHYDLYVGYVNRLMNVQSRASRERDPFCLGRLASEAGFLRNAVLLHELYFTGMTPGGAGKYPDWIREHVQTMGELAVSSTGWVVIAREYEAGGIIVFTMKDHGQGWVAGTMPLLVLDCYEHAYMADYGIKKDKYLDAFFKNIDWRVVDFRVSRT